MSYDHSFDEMLLNVINNKQKHRNQMLGDSQNPLADRIKKKNKHIKDSIMSDRSVESKSLFQSDNLPSVDRVSVSEQASVPQSTPNTFVYQMVEQDKKKQKKKKQKKQKKHAERLQFVISENLQEVDSKHSNLMAELLKASRYMVLYQNDLYVYQANRGCYKKTSRRDVACDLRSLLEYEEQMKITTRQYQESYEQLLISEELECEEGFFENKPYVNCLNGVVDVARGVLLEHSPDYRFKHCINANYIPGEGKCELFLEYLEHITNGDKDLKRLIRVILGYIFSHYFNGKKAFLIYGIPHCGKSVFCAVIEKIMGSEYTSHVDLSKLQKQEYAASLSGKLMNIASDLRNESLSDVGFFKSLVSRDDTISARMLYDNPKDIKCEARMLFSTNHLLTFDSSLDIYDIEAVFNRLIYIPYQNKPISQAQDNKHLSDDLFGERDLIFTWSMKGLRDYIDNNENFPYSKLSEDIKRVNMSRYCAEKVFFEDCLKKADGLYESSSSIKEAFASFCVNNGVNRKADIGRFLDEHQRIPKSKKRIDDEGNLTSSGNPIYVYEGIRLKNKYR